jgi:hypothetical protein
MSVGSYIIHIRSKDCAELTPGYNTHLRVSLKTSIHRFEGERLRISLSSAEIPHAWYGLSDELNSVSIWVDSAVSLELPEGNYDIYELTEAITADATFPFSATYNSITGKVTLENTDGGSGHTINCTQANSLGLSRALGFDADVTVGIGGTAVAPNVANLNTLHSLFLYSSLTATNVITTEHGNYEAILDQIPVKTRPFEVLRYTPYDTAPFSSVLDDDAISSFEISLRDQNGNLVQMNGARYELALLVELHDHADREHKRRKLEEIIKVTEPEAVPLLLAPSTRFVSPDLPRKPVQFTPTQPTPAAIQPIAPVVPPPDNPSVVSQPLEPVATINPVVEEELDNDLDSAILMAHSLDQN